MSFVNTINTNTQFNPPLRKPTLLNKAINKRRANQNKVTSDITNCSKTENPQGLSKIQSLVSSVSTRRFREKTCLRKEENFSNHLSRERSSPTPILTPSLSARPFSQFLFPKKDSTLTFKCKEEEKTTDISGCQRSKRHSIAIIDHHQTHDLLSPSSSINSSRSSSLKTIVYGDSLEKEDEFDKKKSLSQFNTTQFTVARARSALGFNSLKSRETKAIDDWKNIISNLTDETINSNIIDSEVIKIMNHPSLMPEYQLEKQRFDQGVNTKNRSIIKFITNELLETEESYNQLLKLIQKKYMKPMIIASKSKNSLVKSSDIPILFNHLNELVELSDRLLIQFQSTNQIGHIFRLFESDLVIFIKYAIHYRTNIKTIRKACNNILFVKIDQENLSRKDTNRLGMSDYFIAPIQRITRYCLLLKDLQKYIDPLDSTYIDLTISLKILKSLASAMDSIKI